MGRVFFNGWHPLGPLLDAFGTRVAYLSGLPLDSKLSVILCAQNWRWPRVRTSTMLAIQSALPPIYNGDDIPRRVSSKSGLYHTGATWSWLHGSHPSVP